jgi:protein-disulfide isomerase
MEKNAKKSYIVFWVIGIMAIAFFVWYFAIRTESADKSTLKIGNSPVLGDKDAPVVIYEFSDFSCPYCAAAAGYNEEVTNYLKSGNPGWEAPLPLIIENYVKTGKAKIVFKYYPGHGAAMNAHALALALNEQNSTLFWDFVDKAFANQTELDNWDNVNAIARSLGADMDALSRRMKENNYGAMLEADYNMGQANNIKGTPTFFINGKMIKGAQSYSTFKETIDKELN